MRSRSDSPHALTNCELLEEMGTFKRDAIDLGKLATHTASNGDVLIGKRQMQALPQSMAAQVRVGSTP